MNVFLEMADTWVRPHVKLSFSICLVHSVQHTHKADKEPVNSAAAEHPFAIWLSTLRCPLPPLKYITTPKKTPTPAVITKHSGKESKASKEILGSFCQKCVVCNISGQVFCRKLK